MPKKSAKKGKKIPRQKSLPGMQNSKIVAIEKLALDYVELRDERMAIGQHEVELKEKLIALMHKSGKTEYKRMNISIKLTIEKEKIKVRVTDEEEPAKHSAVSDESDYSDQDEEEFEESDQAEVEPAENAPVGEA